MKNADKKIAVVTGGAMGIGAEAATSLARDGHHVVICDIIRRKRSGFRATSGKRAIQLMPARWTLVRRTPFLMPFPGSRASLAGVMFW